MKHLYIHVISYFQGDTGYNIHAREFTKALEKVVYGKNVTVIKSQINDDKELEKNRKLLLGIQDSANIINICISYGSQCWQYLRLFPGLKIAYTYWESTKLPDDWIEPLKHCDYVWTASNWGREIFIQNGLNSEQVFVIPLGVDPKSFNPQQQPHADLSKMNGFKFFNTGKCEPRKGTQDLIVAFDLEFHNNPNVFLVLAAENPFIPKFNLQTFVQHLWLRNYNKFLYVSKGITHEQLAQTMAACHCGVFPTKAEGWGLPILESMALGKPTIVTNYSGVTEYANENNAILLDYYTIPVDGLFFQRADKDYGMWALPNTNTLRKKMREVYENYSHYQEKFLTSSVDVRERWSWQASAQKAWDFITNLIAKEKIILNGESLVISFEQIEKQLDLGIEHHQSGRLAEAETCYQQVLQWQPNHADAWHLLGVIAYQQEQYPTAIERINRGIKLNSNAANFYNSLGSVYQKQQHFTQALDCYQKVIQLQPNFFKAHNNIGLIYQEIGQFQEAIAAYQKAIKLQPNYAEAYLNLSITLEKQRQLSPAFEYCQQAIQLQPDYAEAHCHLGKILHSQGQLVEAVESYQRALQLKSNYADAYANLGTVLQMQGKLTEAIQSFQKALQLEPNQYQTYNNLGGAFQSQGKLKQAIELFQRAIEINPSDVLAYQNLLFGLHYSSDYDLSAIYAEHRQWAALHADRLAKVIAPHDNNRNRERRLRIGYVSGDFKTHSVAYFFEPLLANRNRKDFEVICYVNNSKIDATTQRLRQLADGWREIYALDNEQVAELVRQDKIDILVDLSGHTKDNRLLVFARKPAPVQVTYIGYPNTTGLDTIDYRITDACADPQGETEHLHIEQLIRLPHGFLCYLPSADCPDVSPPPVLQTGQITFGCFNNLAKVNPQLISCWAEILKAVPNSRMIIKYKPLVDPDTCAYVHGLFQQHGIEENRVELIGWLPDKNQHLALYERVDIALDTFPYHGTTTTCEAMWMGVPVITQAGQTHVSRVGVSLLSSVGLEEAIAQSPQEYIQKAIALANNKARLQELRANLRSRMQAAPLTNASLIARSLEEVYRTMWRRFCDQTLLEPDERLVAIAGDVKVCVKNDLTSLTTYILLEQGDWFEAEMAFIRQLIIPGMHILDIGANHGVYTLTIAKLLQGQGQITAYEPASSVVSLLQKGVEANALNTVQIVNAGLSDRQEQATFFLSANSELNSLQQSSSQQLQETIQLLTLDGELAKRNWQSIDFIKLDAEGEEAKILAGGGRFFTEQSPLIMFEFAHGKQNNLSLIGLFQDLGYDIYRFVPGIGYLVPLDVSQPVAGYQLNLFACKPDRSRQLAERKLLVREVSDKSEMPKRDYWIDAIARLNYSIPFLSQWQKYALNSHPDNQFYLEGLNYFFIAKTTNISPTKQFAALQHSFECLEQAVRAKSSFPRRCTLARIAAELGHRQVSVQILQELVATFSSGQSIVIDEPFLPVSQQFDNQPCNNNLSDWLFVSILETYENSRTFSSYFSPHKSVSLLESVVQKPFHSPQVQRRLWFAKQRLKDWQYAMQIYQKDANALSLGLGNYYSEITKTLSCSRNNPANGFFSILSGCFWGLIDLCNLNIIPDKIDLSDEFIAYRNPEQIQNKTDLYPNYFTSRTDQKIEINRQLSKHDHHGIYKKYDFASYNLIVQKYFNLSQSILDIQDALIAKYQIDLSKTIAVCYRGTDKYTEVLLAAPNAYLNLAEKLLQQHPERKILIQTDQKQVRDLFVNYFNERCFFFEEMPVTGGGRVLHANPNLLEVDKFEFGKTLLAVTHLVSRCDLIVNHTGNVAAWICLFRGNADGVFQFDREGQLIVPNQLRFGDPPHPPLTRGVGGDPVGLTQVPLIKGDLGGSKEAQQPKKNRPKFILIKAWGYGFWSDIDHVMGQLLVAELTGRIPIVHWGDNSLYRDAEDENAFENYFEPVSAYRIDDLLGHSYTFYPPKWTEDNLSCNNVNKWEGAGSRLSASALLSRNEDVVVSDFHTYLDAIAPAINPSHPLSGQAPPDIYRYLFQKYLKVRTQISQEIEQFWSDYLAGHNTLAVHVRGSDKIQENPNLKQVNQNCHQAINNYLQRVPDALIFLLTDDASVLEEYQQIYGDRLRYTNASRTRSEVSIHHQNHDCRQQIGIEIIKDTYLAAKCDYFIGNGQSNVSTTILHLKNWSEDRYFLLAENRLFTPHPEKISPEAIASSLDQIFQSAISHHQAGHLQQAEQEYQQVLQQQPNHADAWHLLGVIAAQQKQYQIAIERINRAIELQPETATYYSNLGNAYQESGKLSEAIAYYQKVIQLQPNHVDTYKNMGIAFKEQGQLEEAIQAYKQVLQLKPDYADAHYNLANTLQLQGKLKEAIQALQKTLQLDPNHPQAYNNLAGALQSQGKLKEAIECFQKALEIKPDYAIAYSNMLFSLHYNSDYEPSAICAEHRKWNAHQASALAKAIQPHNNNRNPERRLRIGYVSGDFFTHSVAYFFEPLLTAHNRNNFQVICYANNSKIDATTQRLQQLADGWREIYALDDEQVAALVRQDEIDILVDLSGHTKDNRLLVFARKPAPVQVTYLGYPNTTGLDTIDYRITDACADPQGETEHLHAEQLVRLPHGFLCYLPAANCPDVSPPPVLKSNQITFGCFNNLAKVNPKLIGDWAEILQAVPHSRMIIKSKPLVDPDTCAYLHQLFQQHGIASERVQLLGWLPDKNQHLTLYEQVDIALDTFPYHGTTTTCEAMWMGVPVITQAGSTHLSRVGVSLLSSVGLQDLIAQSAQEYIHKAVELANDRQRLQRLRANLRHWMQASPLTDADAIAHSLEAAYRTMWRHWCEQ